MPWKVTSEMDEKLKFIADCLRDEAPMTVLCERYGISRETGYVWKRRYAAEGVAGLAARRSEEHTSELQSLMSISYDVFCLKKKHINILYNKTTHTLRVSHTP